MVPQSVRAGARPALILLLFTPGAWVYSDDDGLLVAPGPLS